MFNSKSFMFNGKEYPLFIHGHNCGWPGRRMTERSVELAIADRWLNENKHGNIIEIGAVTPYYWPNRISRVLDPSDKSEQVTDSICFSRFEFNNEACLSISTFEHFGQRRYGMKANRTLLQNGFMKLFSQCSKFLVTVPTGYNPICDDFLLNNYHDNINIYCMCRSRDSNYWTQLEAPASIPYGTFVNERSSADWSKNWANGLLILIRG